MFCPIHDSMSYKNTDNKRIEYNLDQHTKDMTTIKTALLRRFGQEKMNNINIIVDELLFKMVHPDERINSIDTLLAIVQTIQI